MKVEWIKTYTMCGSLEVPDNVDEDTQKQMARDHAANTDITITELDWNETDFYNNHPINPEEIPALENDEDKFYDWFSISDI